MTSSRKIDVHVKENGQEIGYRANSPVRKLPDGTAGVVVSGLVYSLYEDHAIDLAEEGSPKSDCPEFFRPGEDLIYAEADEAEDYWFFEKTRWRSYLAFDGSEAFAEQLNAAFEEEGLSDGYRESFRPAKNGHFYDYFIRLPSMVDEEDVRRITGAVAEKEHGRLRRSRRHPGWESGGSGPLDRRERGCQILALGDERAEKPGRSGHPDRRRALSSNAGIRLPGDRRAEGRPRGDHRRLP